MTAKTVELTTLTFAVDDLNFVIQELELSARMYDSYADGADFIGDHQGKEKAEQRRERCIEIARAIAKAGQQGIG